MTTQPPNFGFDEEAVLLRDSVRRLLEEHLPTQELHARIAGDPDPARDRTAQWDSQLWQQMVELGWTALAVPESAGGLGLPLVAVAAVCEELGRAAVPSPLPATLYASVALAQCDPAASAGAFSQILEGASAGLAFSNERGDWSAAAPDVRAATVEQDTRLSGVASFVMDAQKLDYLLVAADHGSGVGLYWVAMDSAGVTLQADAIVDLSRDQARVVFDNVGAIQVAADASAALAAAWPSLFTLLAADQVGAAEWQLQTTVEYASVRKQFEHELGFFQAVKHPLVNAMIANDEARSLIYNAACAIDCEPEQAERAAHMASSAAIDAADFVSSRSVQFHGGIGFTWECYVHLYFKRQAHSRSLFGDAIWHRARLADLVMGSVAA